MDIYGKPYPVEFVEFIGKLLKKMHTRCTYDFIHLSLMSGESSSHKIRPEYVKPKNSASKKRTALEAAKKEVYCKC